MNDGVRLLLGFAAGGLAVAATTLLAERHGSRLGGYIGGLPSTLAVALLFVALTGGRDAAIRASGIAPLSFGINGLYVLLFVALTPLGFYWSMGLALAAWAAAQSAIIIHGAPPLTFSLAAWGICFGLCWLGFSRWFRVPPQPSTGLSTGAGILLLRATVSGALVAAAAAASLWWGAVAGGVLASLPVVFICSLFIAYRRLGLAFARALAGSLVFSAVINCTAFALLFRLALRHLDIFPAFASAYAATLLAAWPLYHLNLGSPSDGAPTARTEAPNR